MSIIANLQCIIFVLRKSFVDLDFDRERKIKWMTLNRGAAQFYLAQYNIPHTLYTYSQCECVLSETAITAVGYRVNIVIFSFYSLPYIYLYSIRPLSHLVVWNEVLYDCNMFSWVKCWKEKKVSMKKERKENESCEQNKLYWNETLFWSL